MAEFLSVASSSGSWDVFVVTPDVIVGLEVWMGHGF